MAESSENIFNTQLENVKRISGFEPKNIAFLTYARLMLMSEEEIEALLPSCAVLDEYYRAGAVRWEGNVRLLLKIFPDQIGARTKFLSIPLRSWMRYGS